METRPIIPHKDTDRPTLKYLYRHVRTDITAKWYDIGVELFDEEDESVLNTIMVNHPDDSDRCTAEMLRLWLDRKSNPTWNHLIDALKVPYIKLEALASKIEGMLSKGAAVIDPETTPTVGQGKGIVKDAVFAETKKAICRIVSPTMTGTGFLGYAKCGEGKYCTVLVTNNHVITNFDDAMGSRIIFENVFDHNVTLRGRDIFVINSLWFSPMTELDFALIEVDDSKLVDPTSKRSLDINSIQMIRPADVREGDQIYVIQHPRGEQIAFSSSDSVVLNPLLLYQCTTDYGSSGSPVFKEVDGELKVVALHRGGRDGGNKWLGYNCGTLIKEILNHLYGNQAQSLIAKLEALQFSKAADKENVMEVVLVQEEINSFVPPVQENRIYPQEQIDGVQDYGQEQRNGAAVIDPETAPTVCRGKGIVKDAVFAETKKAICRIISPSMTGTGFLGYAKCGEGKYCTVLVTNNHVITNFDDAMGSRIIFENVFDHNVTLRGPDIFVMNSLWFSPMTELDFVLIEVDDSKLVDPTTKRSLDIISFQMIRPADVREGDQIYIIQHPHGEQIAFSSSDSVVLNPLLLYQCTTDYGSSGSPVFKEVDGELKVVALHRGGRDGGDKWLGYNCGTLIKEILNHLYGNQTQSLPSNHTVQEALRRINK